jgi:hypothetical protein
MNTRKSRPLLGLLVGAVLVTTACSGISISDNDDIPGSGTIESEMRSVSDFDRIVLAGEGHVIVTHAAGATLEIETDDNLLEYIESDVTENTLTLSTRRRVDIDPSDTVTYRIGVPQLTGIELRGAGNFDLSDWDVDSFEILLAGAGNVDIIGLTADTLDVTLSGAGTVRLSGEVSEQFVNLPGAGSYKAEDLRSTEAILSSTGAIGATVWVTDVFDLSVSGAGSVGYYGNPQLDQSITGAGAVRSLGSR